MTVSFLAAALAGGAKVGWDLLSDGAGNYLALLAKVLVVGLFYTVGLIIAIASVRLVHAPHLEVAIDLYCWFVIAATCFLYIVVISRMYEQQYDLW